MEAIKTSTNPFMGKSYDELAAMGPHRYAMDTPELLRQYWRARGTALLRGKTVAFVMHAPYEDSNRHAPTLVFTDGSILILQADDEGNGPGAGLFRNSTKTEDFFEEILPAL